MYYTETIRFAGEMTMHIFTWKLKENHVGVAVLCKCTPLNHTNSAIWQNVNFNDMCCIPTISKEDNKANIGRYSGVSNKLST